jgi:hypothetical protein
MSLNSVHSLRTRLDRLAVHLPTRPMTSEEAIRECAVLVEEMKAAGVVVPDTSEPMTDEEEAALITRALAEADAELGQAAQASGHG